jgi:hypothetical protein
MKKIISASLLSCLMLLGACGDDGGGGAGGDGGVDEIPALRITGSVVDFSTGDPLTGGATISTDGLSPAPTVSVTGANFEITGIPPFSNFHLLAGSPPDYRSTYSVVVQVEDTDRTDLTVEALSEDFIDSLYATFAVTETAGTSLVVAKLMDDQGAALADVPASAFALEAGTDGPYFLDADKAPDAALTKSSASGYVVVFNVAPGLVSFVADEGANLTLLMADSPVANRAATLAEIVVSDGAIVVPTGVSFSQDITPIFDRRGCVLCHSGSGIGKDLGGLHLNGEANKMYKELAEEISANHGITRVNLASPAESLMLTFPSKEEPPDVHPNVTFISNADPDYLLMLGWITEGALNN